MLWEPVTHLLQPIWLFAGIESKIPVDEVIDAMYQVGSSLPTAFRETAEGGLATTPTGRRLSKEILRITLTNLSSRFTR